MTKLIAALSGGVDSAVAAARMLDAGFELKGVHLKLWGADQAGLGSVGCGSDQDTADAAQVASRLGIDFEVWRFDAEFERDVVSYFGTEYASGRTPNPCLRCNQLIKFGALIDRALELGYDGVATGHYARLRHQDGRVELHRAADESKDQSYVLAVLTPPRLRCAFFPLGDSLKSAIRVEAATRGFAVSDKPDSTDICFIPDGDTQGWLQRRLGSRPGNIVDVDGQVLGTHDGTYRFTVGQRKGLRLRRPASDGRPRFVLRVDPDTATVVVGPRERLAVRELVCGQPSWCEEAPTDQFRAGVQVRAHGREFPATVRSCGDQVVVRADEPIYGVAPGQSAVFYDGTRVCGAAVIEQSGAV